MSLYIFNYEELDYVLGGANLQLTVQSINNVINMELIIYWFKIIINLIV